MSFDPFLFCKFAEKISSQDRSEVALRTSVGRTYYGVYLMFREKLKGQIRAKNLRHKPHSSVINWIRKHHRLSGDLLGELFDLRLQADYELENSPPYDDWLSNWKRAYAISQQLITRLPKIVS